MSLAKNELDYAFAEAISFDYSVESLIGG